VQHIAIVSDEPGQFDAGNFPPGTTISHRRELDAIQRELRDIPGVTVLVYAQTCATEKRRRRKRGKLEEPQRFVVINDLVCEGCGDCSVESNCLSVVPKETPFGRKRQIDQNSCNKDYSCLNGFCPSFVTVEGGKRRTPSNDGYPARLEQLQAELPEPAVPAIDHCYDLLVTGVGGTGVITVSALITMAAHLERKGATELDFMGFSQKFGPVISYLRIANEPRDINQVRIEKSSADALVGCDLVVSSSPKASATYRKDHTRTLLNTAEMPTGEFVRSRDVTLGADERIAAIRDMVGEHNLGLIDANGLASRLMGDTIFANIIMVGAAWQRGLVPVSLDALLRAIELNGVRIEENTKAFQWGRVAAHDPDAIARLLDGESNVVETLDRMIERRRAFLVDYQDDTLAARYLSLVERVRAAEADIAAGDALTTAVANAYFRLLSYKDEYEVARLHTQPEFLEMLRAEYGKSARLRFHLAPPLLGGRRDARGRPLKREFGAWVLPLFRLLAKFRRLRGTALDIFGYTAERRMERSLIGEFENAVDAILASLDAENRDQAVAAVDCFREIRGYGPVKEAAVDEARARLDEALAAVQQPGAKAA
jgi:indolepyruvate ferredoxin oxidoreductase